ncbi:uncharacterized protein LOC107264177 isoform X1 [Cephus cinctus]|uniref:Uncharacterized protein LOC107264177 isoform X1 n=1 Tax=Cephus cinctus TaxID=211228 RepID=A0AAJ7FED8_CEPCN|nr:uncharacterized protein LOC107264177 isoform X1 [Cephus cinctus]
MATDTASFGFQGSAMGYKTSRRCDPEHTSDHPRITSTSFSRSPRSQIHKTRCSSARLTMFSSSSPFSYCTLLSQRCPIASHVAANAISVNTVSSRRDCVASRNAERDPARSAVDQARTGESAEMVLPAIVASAPAAAWIPMSASPT